MARNERLQWTPIETDVKSGDTQNLEMNVNESEEIEELENNNVSKGKSQDSRRGILTVSSPKTSEKEEDDQDGTEVEKDQDERTSRKESTRVVNQDSDEDEPKREGRAHKRIKSLIGRLNEKDQELNQLRQAVITLRSNTFTAQKKTYEAQKNQWKQILADKESQLEAAVNSDDAKAITKATKELSDAQMRVNAYEAASEEYEDTQQEEQQQQEQPRSNVPEEARAWVKRNPWFLTDQKKMVVARMISAEMSQEGEYAPDSEEYWTEMDKRLTEFGIRAGKTKNNSDNDEQQEVPKTKKRGSPVGSRREEDSEDSYDINKQFSRKGNTVTAHPTQDDYDMAEKFSIDIDSYMKEKYKYAKQGFKGYVPIDIPGQ